MFLESVLVGACGWPPRERLQEWMEHTSDSSVGEDKNDNNQRHFIGEFADDVAEAMMPDAQICYLTKMNYSTRCILRRLLPTLATIEAYIASGRKVEDTASCHSDVTTDNGYSTAHVYTESESDSNKEEEEEEPPKYPPKALLRYPIQVMSSLSSSQISSTPIITAQEVEISPTEEDYACDADSEDNGDLATDSLGESSDEDEQDSNPDLDSDNNLSDNGEEEEEETLSEEESTLAEDEDLPIRKRTFSNVDSDSEMAEEAPKRR